MYGASVHTKHKSEHNSSTRRNAHLGYKNNYLKKVLFFYDLLLYTLKLHYIKRQ
jgi:hypothetical protein